MWMCRICLAFIFLHYSAVIVLLQVPYAALWVCKKHCSHPFSCFVLSFWFILGLDFKRVQFFKLVIVACIHNNAITCFNVLNHKLLKSHKLRIKVIISYFLKICWLQIEIIQISSTIVAISSTMRSTIALWLVSHAWEIAAQPTKYMHLVSWKCAACRWMTVYVTKGEMHTAPVWG